MYSSETLRQRSYRDVYATEATRRARATRRCGRWPRAAAFALPRDRHSPQRLADARWV